MIREATHDDIPALVEMGRQFHAMAPHNPMGAYDGEGVGRMLAFLIESPSAVVLTNGDGAIGGVMAPIYFCPSKLMMEEAFWWARKGGRDLLREFEVKSREMGAACLYLSTLENEHWHLIDRVVTRRGFAPIERRYVKEL